MKFSTKLNPIRNWYISFLRNYSTKFQEITEFANGKTLSIETGNYAKLADGSAVATVGETSVLVTSVSKVRPGAVFSFLPLTVDYKQKYAAAGRIPSNYFRREMAPTEKEILTSRVIDRSLRPLFPPDYLYETQISCQLLAVDGMHEPDVISINAASAALAISNIPWHGPIGAVKVGIIDDEAVIFPSRKELKKSILNMIIVASSGSKIVMLEGSGAPVEIQDLQHAIKIGCKECQKIIKSIQNLSSRMGVKKKHYDPSPSPSEDILGTVRSISSIRIEEIFKDYFCDKISRDNKIQVLREDVVKKLSESYPNDSTLLHDAFSKISKEVFRNNIFEEDRRCDGRSLDDMREISCSVDLFKPLHGSSLFQRGQTQVQCTVAYDSPNKTHKIDPLAEATGSINEKNFLLHYSFPSFANNELPRGGQVTRREIGHGALAAKGLRPLIPSENPFCILVTSTVLESNGSSSMATVCGGSLALMDAGVNIPSHASGVAIGLITKTNEDGEIEDYKILTDIMGIEDYLGDMDLKLASTKLGVTALQADIKLPGVPLKIIMESIQKGYIANISIIKIMNKSISKPTEHKYNFPVVTKKQIPPHKRASIMGVGGIKLRKMQAELGIEFSWEDNETLSLFAPNQAAHDEALQTIDASLEREPELEFGAIYEANIVEIRQQGVMVTLYEGMTPVLLHNSQLDTKKVLHASVLNLEVDGKMKVKYFGRDPSSGHMRLSRRVLLTTMPANKKLFKEENS